MIAVYVLRRRVHASGSQTSAAPVDLPRAGVLSSQGRGVHVGSRAGDQRHRPHEDRSPTGEGTVELMRQQRDATAAWMYQQRDATEEARNAPQKDEAEEPPAYSTVVASFSVPVPVPGELRSCSS
eukprot:scaffold110672_cov18-Phaeocystis_antarctica.AAC.1